MSQENPTSIGELAAQIEDALCAIRRLPNLPAELRALRHLCPSNGKRPRVKLCHQGKEKYPAIHRTASAHRWTPDAACYVRIEYVAGEGDNGAHARDTAHPNVDENEGTAAERGAAKSPIRELLSALLAAEADPKLHFVSLKWFRDTFLPTRGFEWTKSAEDRQAAIADAIGRKLVSTGKVPNPKSPNFPVTTIRVNRTNPAVSELLSGEPTTTRPFRPIAIRGEPLSETILRDRR